VQDFSFLLVELHEVPVNPFLQPVAVLLDGGTTFWCISHSPQFDVIIKLAKGTLYPIIQSVNEDIKEDWTQCGPLGYLASYWPSIGLHTTDL